MTTAHQQIIPNQVTVPAARASRRRSCDLPEPGERRRLREQWGLSVRQVAMAFGVTPATVRSWECGRSAPRGGRKEAYRRFLAGLAQYSETTRRGAPVRGADGDRRPAAGVLHPVPRPVDGTAPIVRPAVSPRSACPPLPVAGGGVRVAGGSADPVAPERIRRLRLLGAAACVWWLALWVILTCPPPV